MSSSNPIPLVPTGQIPSGDNHQDTYNDFNITEKEGGGLVATKTIEDGAGHRYTLRVNSHSTTLDEKFKKALDRFGVDACKRLAEVATLMKERPEGATHEEHKWKRLEISSDGTRVRKVYDIEGKPHSDVSEEHYQEKKARAKTENSKNSGKLEKYEARLGHMSVIREIFQGGGGSHSDGEELIESVSLTHANGIVQPSGIENDTKSDLLKDLQKKIEELERKLAKMNIRSAQKTKGQPAVKDDQSQQRILFLTEQLARLEEQLRQLQGQQKGGLNTNRASDESRAAAMQQISDLFGKIAVLESQLAAMKAARTAVPDTQKGETVGALEQKIGQFQAQVSQLENELQTSRSVLKDNGGLVAKNAELQHQIEKLEVAFASLKAQQQKLGLLPNGSAIGKSLAQTPSIEELGLADNGSSIVRKKPNETISKCFSPISRTFQKAEESEQTRKHKDEVARRKQEDQVRLAKHAKRGGTVWGLVNSHEEKIAQHQAPWTKKDEDLLNN
ncbi:MAG: hypothetical protein WCF65_08935 [Parachlamydiaceae bacterium]